MAEEAKPKFVVTKVEVEGRTFEVMVQTQDPLPKWEQVSVVGQAVERMDAIEKVTGRARYTHDIQLPSMVWGRIVRSSRPHARVLRIDPSPALALPGVVGVLLPEDVKDYKIGNEVDLLSQGEVRYVGEEVAAVAAVTEEIAHDAAQLVRVEYQDLPAVTDAEEAMRSGAPVVKEGGNIFGGKPRVYQRGDVNKGFAEADHIFEETFTTAPAHHACMETHCCVCAWEGDGLIVYESTQGIFGVQEAVARALKIPSGKVRVLCSYMGGGFGSKGGGDKYTVIAALFSKKLQKPVKIVLTRQEDFISAFYRAPSVQTLKIGVGKDGTLAAIQLKAINQIGAYQRNANWGSCEDPAAETYACPHVRTEGYSVHTHMPIPAAMRGPGKTQGAWAMEQMMDIIADKLNLDPIELRMKNYAHTEPMTGLRYASNGLDQCYRAGAEKFG
ncbi:MAG: xanthine dehydrogenase family protein molybdopterin-binding subunit, partial [Acidobacteria bacterium]|nr:xanthine dehydrogenase family protein molybdopterin-binding subunit [Acidobacteriota bacterium]